MSLRKYRQTAEQAAREAGDMLQANIDSHREIFFKSEVDIVTNFDKRSQKIIIKHLSKNFPKHGLLAEEGLINKKGNAYRWIIDPIDGTTNFAHKFPVFCITIALQQENEIVLGVVYDPMREEMFTAAKGEGAVLNEQSISVSKIDDLGKSLLSTGFPYDVRESEKNNITNFTKFITRAQDIRRCGSAALDLCFVACGRFDGFWELKLKPWDVAAGALIVNEAGGHVSDFKGRVFNISGEETLASNGLIHAEMVNVLKKDE